MTQFDIAFTAPSTLKERFVWLVYLGIVFFLLYGSANQYAAIINTDTAFFMQWEKGIPFIEWFIVPYMSSDILFVIAFLLPQRRIDIKTLALRSFFAIAVSVITFVLLPLKFSFDKPPVDNFLFDMLKMDLPYNQMPSLHISLAVILWFSMKNTIQSKLIKSILLIWLVLIGLSTLLVYQHHFIDLPSGFLLGMAMVYLFNEKKPAYFSQSFTTPRHLKIALYYLVLSILLMVLAFKLSSFICFYLFISVFSISVIYAFGLNGLLMAPNKGIRFLQKLFFLPYFVGSHLSWLYYKRNIPFISQYNERIYFGRQADDKEYQQLKQLGINKIINLCPELPFHKTDILQHHYDFLDLTMQHPSRLFAVIKDIDSSSDKVYIHCKLGMSRTILVIAAYLLYHGNTLMQIEDFLQQQRPFYVKSKYMTINLALFRQSLKN